MDRLVVARGDYTEQMLLRSSHHLAEGRIKHMLYWAFVFLVIAIIAGVFGFGGIAGTATDIARVLFVLFLVPICCGSSLGQSRPLAGWTKGFDYSV
jgi:uncharacterized membrane protein YtjA (UPF0391 family)